MGKCFVNSKVKCVANSIVQLHIHDHALFAVEYKVTSSTNGIRRLLFSYFHYSLAKGPGGGLLIM